MRSGSPRIDANGNRRRMSPMRKTLIAVALIVAGGALPACAQRGGSRGGSAGRSGGFAVHSAPAFRSSPAPVTRGSFMSAQQFSGSRYADTRPTQHGVSQFSSIGEASRRRPVNSGEYRYRRPYVPAYGAAVPYSVVGWLGPNCVGVVECDFLDDAYATPAAGPAAPENYPAENYGPAPLEQPEVAPAEPFRPEYARPQPVQDLEPEAAVTLIFKDGRPSEQIHNYMLTRTTLYVQERHLREIPVDQLDLPAMAKVNHEAGVDFQLPGSAK